MNMTGFTIAATGGQSFHLTEWLPSGRPKGLVLLLHGLSEHAGRYRHVGAALAASGYVMVCPDLRGNGQSSGKRGHFPYYRQAMEDVTLFMEVARNRHPDLPVVLYGHSMGGNLALNYLIRHRPAVAGSVVTSPWLRLSSKPPLMKLLLALAVEQVLPSLSQPDGIFPGFLSHDEAVGRAYEADPLVHNRISVRTFLEVSRAGDYALAHAATVSCPLLLMHGTGDRLTSCDASREFSDRMVTEHTFRTWEGLYHELHNEFEREQVLAAVTEWMDRLLPPGNGQ
jgi:alpha-beta hydrolase superfamily lysophospholipase